MSEGEPADDIHLPQLWDCKFFGVTPEEEGDTCD
jgi:hypothetical protein